MIFNQSANYRDDNLQPHRIQRLFMAFAPWETVVKGWPNCTTLLYIPTCREMFALLKSIFGSLGKNSFLLYYLIHFSRAKYGILEVEYEKNTKFKRMALHLMITLFNAAGAAKIIRFVG